MDFGPQQFGRWLVAIGAAIVVIGVLVILLGRIGLFRLPGDPVEGSAEAEGNDHRAFWRVLAFRLLTLAGNVRSALASE